VHAVAPQRELATDLAPDTGAGVGDEARPLARLLTGGDTSRAGQGQAGDAQQVDG
jgi:hypothetical protein